MLPNFIVVDDDCISNLICAKIITQAIPNAEVLTFLDPNTALVHIISTFSKPVYADTILFLDINMPSMSGWEFLKIYELFNQEVKDQVKIFMLSSSVDERDKLRAANNKNVWGYIEKPLTKEKVLEMLGVLC